MSISTYFVVGLPSKVLGVIMVLAWHSLMLVQHYRYLFHASLTLRNHMYMDYMFRMLIIQYTYALKVAHRISHLIVIMTYELCMRNWEVSCPCCLRHLFRACGLTFLFACGCGSIPNKSCITRSPQAAWAQVSLALECWLPALAFHINDDAYVTCIGLD